MFDMTCVIFAGGKSSRMGQDKSLLPFANAPTLIEYQFEKLKKLFTTVHIVAKSSEKFAQHLQEFIITDVVTPTYAPTAGFVAMFEKLEGNNFFVLSVDSPFIDETIISNLIQADSTTLDACIAKTSEGMQPMCGIYHRSLYSEFQRMLKEDNHKLGWLLKNSNTYSVTFKDSKSFMNLNHPHEYEEALKSIT